MRECPFCAKRVKAASVTCRSCRRDLTGTARSADPRSSRSDAGSPIPARWAGLEPIHWWIYLLVATPETRQGIARRAQTDAKLISPYITTLAAAGLLKIVGHSPSTYHRNVELEPGILKAVQHMAERAVFPPASTADSRPLGEVPKSQGAAAAFPSGNIEKTVGQDVKAKWGKYPHNPLLHTCTKCGHTMTKSDRRLNRRPKHDRLTGSTDTITLECEWSGLKADERDFKRGPQRGWRLPPEIVSTPKDVVSRTLDCFYCKKSETCKDSKKLALMSDHRPNDSARAGYSCPGSGQPPGKITEFSQGEEAAGEMGCAIIGVIALAVLLALFSGLSSCGSESGSVRESEPRLSAEECAALRMVALDNSLSDDARGTAAAKYDVYCR